MVPPPDGRPTRTRTMKPNLGRRDFLKAAVGLGAAAAAGSSAALVPSHRYGPVAEAVEFEVPGLDPAHDGLRVAQLSDLHVGPRTPEERIRAAIALANGFEPDLVVLTGDYLSRDPSGVGLLGPQLAGLRGPAVAVLGNHDHWVDPAGAARELGRLGCDVLRNQHTRLTLRGVPFTVVGVDDLHTGNADPARALRGAPTGSRLVLAHGPRTADLLRDAPSPLLMLSGHTHGGQVNVPLLTPYLVRALAQEPYLRGRFALGPVQLYVNRGIGNSALRIRLNADPEVTLATLRVPRGGG